MSATCYGVSRWMWAVVMKPWFWPTAHGHDRVPISGPVILASNHSSFLDPLLVGTMTRRQVRFVARATLADFPIIGWWMRAVGTRFVDRDAPSGRALQAVVGLLREGELVAVFPEGTRSRNGELGPFRRGLLLLLKKTSATVVPTGIRGSFEAFPRGRRFPRLFRRCSVVFGEPMTAEEVLSDGGLEALRQRVGQLSGQTLAEGSGGKPPTSDSRGSSTLSGGPADPRVRASGG